MRFVVFGAGAIGGVIGARLAEGGHEVALVARGRHLEAIRLAPNSGLGGMGVRGEHCVFPGEFGWRRARAWAVWA